MGRGDGADDAFEEILPDDRSLDALIPDERDGPSSPVGRLAHWVLLDGERIHVTAALVLGVLVALLALSAARAVDMYALLSETNTIQMLFNSLLRGTIVLVSVVVSITSIVLSEEITDIEDQRERIDASIRYRAEIEQFIEHDVSPARPAEFLRVILLIIDRQARNFADMAADSGDEEFASEAATYYDEVTAEVERMVDTLSDARFGTFKVLLAGLNYDYSWQLHVARRFERKYGDDLDDEEREAIDDLVETLKVFATGREYFKSLYYKREFANLSRNLLYVSLPTIVVTSYVLLAIDTNLFPEVSVFALTPMLVFVSAAYTVALVPYLTLTSYVVRAMTVTLRTLASGPFILHGGAEIEEFDWDDAVDDSELDVPGVEGSRGDD